MSLHDAAPRRTRLLDRVFRKIEGLKPSDRLLLKGSLLVFFVSLAFALLSLNNSLLVNIPNEGGAYVEGIVGTPRFINPLLAVTPADKDIVSLVYSGLMRLGEGGVLENDLAESITASEDGLTYNVILKDGIKFHDGTAVTSDDIIFTVSRAQDPALKSPLLSSWEGVRTERVSEREFNFILERPYAPFLENLSLGILPKHIWEEAGADAFPFSQYNSEPIGSGPYEVKTIERSTSGIPEAYVLVPFDDHAGQVARIESIRLVFYSNQAALIEDFKLGLIGSAAGLSAQGIASLPDVGATHTVLTTPLPRTFAIFFNQNESAVFRDASARAALLLVTDRKALIEQALGNQAYAITGPIPPTTGNITAVGNAVTEATIDEARNVLRNGGWKMDEASGRWKKKIGDVDVELTFKLATANTEILERTADLIKQQWERIGAVVEVEKYEQVDLTQSVIRPRKYDALLFGTVIGREQDFYPFWHNSQRNDPGLNIALYANLTTDAILAEARTIQDPVERAKKNEEFAAEIAKDIPAIFLYVPAYTYIVPKNVREVSITGLAEPNERFATIDRWYTETEAVWPLFAR